VISDAGRECEGRPGDRWIKGGGGLLEEHTGTEVASEFVGGMDLIF